MLTYRTKYGAIYTFSFNDQSDGNIICRIISMPSYGPRDTSLYKTHREYKDGWLCVDYGMPLSSMELVKNAVGAWAECTDGYIRSGSWCKGK